MSVEERKTMRLAPSNRHAIPKWGANHWSSLSLKERSLSFLYLSRARGEDKKQRTDRLLERETRPVHTFALTGKLSLILAKV